ncbi:helix-turn-helix domain-containing protein [Qipengyuania marisflavi]|uniref:Helix-turn-helix domain-containing protein n=1 Tax=Qipengyuania marisflavi TaxID=2486356 RepID=A0A5S3P3F4_9SPHN|nr:helix-turn-helix domain-containing protein [Qipengyuania marisflavi]TMM47368.1 helix-turn-helix domain-containing protein [Qipengyuania marisflavi]
MEQDDIVEETATPSDRVGDRLRLARQEAGYELSQVAAETRIPHRHLVAIEAGHYAELPSRTYAIGFARTYARMVGLDERDVVDQVRAELAEGTPGNGVAGTAKFEPGDPARVPSRGLAWFAVLAAILLMGGVYAFYSSYLAPGLGPAPLTEETPLAAKAPAKNGAAAGAATPVAASGPVVFTSLMDDTWVKFYDAKGERLYEAQMAKGDSFTIPADAEGPQVWTGRPYALAITVGGKTVPKLSEEDVIMKDIPVTAQALASRPAPARSTAAPTTPPAARTAPAG